MASTAGDSRRNKRLREVQANDRRIEKLVIESIMSHPDGRRWIWNTLGICQLHTAVGAASAELHNWSEGHRNIGLQLEAQIMRHAPKMLAQMMQENSSSIQEEKEDDNGTDSQPT